MRKGPQDPFPVLLCLLKHPPKGWAVTLISCIAPSILSNQMRLNGGKETYEAGGKAHLGQEMET